MRLLLLLMVPASVWGTTFVEAFGHGGIDGFSLDTPVNFNTGQLASTSYNSGPIGGTNTDIVGDCFSAGVAHCFATGTGNLAAVLTIDPGALRGSIDTSGLFTKDPQFTPTIFGSTGAGLNMTGQFRDTLTVTGPTPGSVVQLKLDYYLDSTVGGINAQAVLSGFLGNRSFQVSNQVGFPPGLQSGSVQLNTTVGSTVDLLASLNLTASSIFSDVGGPASTTAFVHASNTGAFAVSVLTPGAGYTTESGALYDTFAPEPAASGLVASGLLIAVALRFVRNGVGNRPA